jgi:hypothetical protein
VSISPIRRALFGDILKDRLSPTKIDNAASLLHRIVGDEPKSPPA